VKYFLLTNLTLYIDNEFEDQKQLRKLIDKDRGNIGTKYYIPNSINFY